MSMNIKKLRGPSPQANYTDLATAAEPMKRSIFICPKNHIILYIAVCSIFIETLWKYGI
jgi:hypothetical protein